MGLEKTKMDQQGKITEAADKIKAQLPPSQAGGSESLSQYWNRNIPNPDDKVKVLAQLGPLDNNGMIFTSAASDLNKPREEKQNIANIKGENLKGQAVETESGVDRSYKLQTLKMAQDMFDAADKAGYKTADQFRTAFDTLKGFSPTTKKLTSDPAWVNMTSTQGAKLKDVLAEYYARTVAARDRERGASAQQNQTAAAPATNAPTPIAMQAAQQAQAPAATAAKPPVRVRVTN